MIGALLVAVHAPSSALDPQRPLAQLHHKSWTIEDGAPPDVWALAQTADGYLWLGTGAGLYRFDGVRFERFRPLAKERLPAANINALMAEPTGELWIGFEAGQITRLRNGHLTNYDLGLGNMSVLEISGNSKAGIWAALKNRKLGALARFSEGKWTVAGKEMGLPAGGVSSVLAAHDGSVWVAVGGYLWVLRQGADQFERTAERVQPIARIFEAREGQIWISPGAPYPIHALETEGHAKPAAIIPQTVEESGEKIWVDRDGSLWGARKEGGIFRSLGSVNGSPIQDGQLGVETFTLKDGLSSDIASPLFEDREGNIWVGTNLGIDRFGATSAVSAAGIPSTSRRGYQISAGEDGAVFVLTTDSLFKAYPNRAAEKIASVDAPPSSIYMDRSGTIWAGLADGMARLEGGLLRPVALPDSAKGIVTGWLELLDNQLCVSVLDHGIFCRVGNVWQAARAPFGPNRPAPVQMLGDHKNRIWLNYEDRLVLIDGSKERDFTESDGLRIGSIELISEFDDQIYAMGDFGLARFDGERFTTLNSDDHPVLSRLSGLAKGVDGAMWLNGIAGVVRLTKDDLNIAFTVPESPLRSQIFNRDDGLPGVAQQDANTPTALASSDGRLWFVTSHGVAWIDPRKLTQNPLPPPVSVSRLTSGNRSYFPPASITLPAGTSSVQIDYTALSLSVPHRVQFSYQLEGVDAGPVNPGQRRQAFYTGLGPGEYTFRVMASNNDGVWNRTGASVSFVIPPTFIQSIWFKLLIAIALVVAGRLLYSLRLRQVATAIRGQLEERLRERERIARELHDTLLQGFQGLVYRFQSEIQTLPASYDARANLEEALDMADAALAEGRDRVYNLRHADSGDDMARHFATTAAHTGFPRKAAVKIVTEGRARVLHPLVREEILRIGDEAISNAIQHSNATEIEINIVYRDREVLLQISDDGCGIDPEVMRRGGREYHFGLTGMRERAEVIRAEFSISSMAGGGTQVTLTVPASVAYLRPVQRKWRFLKRKHPLEA